MVRGAAVNIATSRPACEYLLIKVISITFLCQELFCLQQRHNQCTDTRVFLDNKYAVQLRESANTVKPLTWEVHAKIRFSHGRKCQKCFVLNKLIYIS